MLGLNLLSRLGKQKTVAEESFEPPHTVRKFAAKSLLEADDHPDKELVQSTIAACPQLEQKLITAASAASLLTSQPALSSSSSASSSAPAPSADPAAFKFPTDDIEIIRSPQETRIASTSLPHATDAGLATAPDFVKKLVEQYRADDVTYRERQGEHGGLCNFIKIEPGAAVGLSEHDLPDTAVKNPTKSGLSDQIVAQFDEHAESRRRVAFRTTVLQRPPVFDTCEAGLRETLPTDPRHLSKTSPPVPSVEILAEAVSLRCVNLDSVEPIFCSLAFYDASGRKKLTETWSFDFNDRTSNLVGALVQMGRGNRSPECDAKRAVFQLFENNPAVFCLVTLSKVISGQDIDETVEPFFKTPSNMDKHLDKVMSRVRRLGYFLQPFAFGIAPLYDQSGKLHLAGNISFDLTKYKTALTEAQVFEIFAKRQEPQAQAAAASSAASKKRLPIELVLMFKRVRPTEVRAMPARLSVSMQPLTPAASDASTPIVREIAAFPNTTHVRRPYSEYEHVLFFRPQSLNFNRHPNSSSRNIALRVALMRSDFDPHAPGSTTIVGRSSSPLWNSRQLLSVTYHETKPTWVSDEVKILLPPDLQAGDHLVVTFSHVSCADPAEKKALGMRAKASQSGSLLPLPDICDSPTRDQTVEQDLGFAWIPLFDPLTGIVHSGTKSIPVATTFVPNYLNPGLAPGGPGSAMMKYVDSGKQIFTYSLEVLSSLYPADPAVYQFLAQAADFAAGAKSEAEVHRSLVALSSADANILVGFLPSVLGALNDIVAKAKPAVGKIALEAIAAVVLKVQESFPETNGPLDRNQLVESFIRFRVSSSSLHDPFLAALLEITDWACILRSIWYIFDVVLKSMFLAAQTPLVKAGSSSSPPALPERDKSSAAVPLTERAQRFPFLHHALPALCRHFVALQRGGKLAELPSLNSNFTIFLKELLRVADRGLVAASYVLYITSLDPDSSFLPKVQVKMESLRIFSNFEHWIALNLPSPLANVPAITQATLPNLLSLHCSRHVFVGLLLLETKHCLASEDPQIRALALRVIRGLLWKHAKDARYQSQEAQEIIANLYFPLIEIMAGAHESLELATAEEKRDWMLAFLHLVRLVHRNLLLRPFWANQTQKTIVSLLSLFQTSVSCFAEPTQIREASFVVLDVLTSFIYDYRQDRRLIAPDSHYMKPAFDCFLTILDKPQTVVILGHTCRILKWVIHTFANVIFQQPDPYYCGELCYHVIKNTNIPNGILQSEAAGLWWVLIETNQLVRKNFARVSLQSTIAISRLASSDTADYAQLLTSLGHIQKQATLIFARQSAEIKELMNRLHKVIEDSLRIIEFKSDPEMTCELYYQVSLGYQGSPDLRITRLENLAAYHISRQYWEEAAQCKLFMASLVLEYLLQIYKEANPSVTLFADSLSTFETGPNQGVPQSTRTLQRLAPGLSREPGLPIIRLEEAGEEGVYTNKLFTINGFWSLLRECSAYFKKGSYFELGLDISELFINRFQSARDYGNLSRYFREMQLLASCIHSEERIFARFYRIAFLGSEWGPQLNQKLFIYKEQNSVMLPDITRRLQEQFAKKFPGAKIQMLPNSTQLATPEQRAAAKTSLDASTLYFQIISVTPYLTQADLSTRQTEWERCYDIKQFWYSVPFTIDGSKPSDDFSKQCIRKTLLTVEKPFPFVKTRQEIIKSDVIELSPIETANEMIQEKVEKIRSASLEANKAADGVGLRSEKEACNVLQQLLQGAVLTMVNAGPFSLATLFLSEPTKFQRPHVCALRLTFIDFMDAIKEALAAVKRVVSGDLIPFQHACDESFAEMTVKFQVLLDKTKDYV